MNPIPREAAVRTIPIAVVLAPQGILFGFGAAQVDWSVLDVLVMGVLGFTASGQFTYLKIHADPISPAVFFVILLFINIRYVPMLLASRRVGRNPAWRALTAHAVSDASFALERPGDDDASRAAIRILIWSYWVGWSVVGVLIADLLPAGSLDFLEGVTFPASAVVVTLMIDRVVIYGTGRGRTAIPAVAAAGAVAAVGLAVLGPSYFWIPSIAVGTTVAVLLHRDPS